MPSLAGTIELSDFPLPTRKPTGSFTGDMAVDAMVNARRLQATKPGATAPTLADAILLAGTDLKVGEIVTTNDYAVASDGGGNRYQLMDAGSAGNRPAAVTGSVIHVGSNGLWLKGLFTKTLRTSQCGADVTSALAIPGVVNILVDAPCTIAANLSIPESVTLVEDGGYLYVNQGVTLRIARYRSNGKYFIRRHDHTAIVEGHFINDESIPRLSKRNGQQAITFGDGYSIGSPSSGYVNNWSSGTKRFAYEDGEMFVKIKFRGSFAQLRLIFLDEGNTTLYQKDLYPMGSGQSYDATRSTLFNDDNIEKCLVLRTGVSSADFGSPAKIQALINPTATYQGTRFELISFSFGFANNRHLTYIQQDYGFGVKAFSARNGIDGLWYKDPDYTEIMKILETARSIGSESVRLFMPFKSVIDENGLIIHDDMEKYEYILRWCLTRGLLVMPCLSFIFNDGSSRSNLVYPDMIDTETKQDSVLTQMGRYVAHFKNHPAIFAYDVQNEVNHSFDDGTLTPALIHRYIAGAIDIVHSNSNAKASLSLSSGGRAALFCAIDFGQDFVDKHFYGTTVSQFYSGDYSHISLESGDTFNFLDAAEFCGTVSPWFQFVYQNSDPAFIDTVSRYQANDGAITPINSDVYATTTYGANITSGANNMCINPLAATSGDALLYTYIPSGFVVSSQVP